MSSPRKKRDNLSVLKVYLSFIHINTTLKKMAHGIHDIKVILMYTNNYPQTHPWGTRQPC